MIQSLAGVSPVSYSPSQASNGVQTAKSSDTAAMLKPDTVSISPQAKAVASDKDADGDQA